MRLHGWILCLSFVALPLRAANCDFIPDSSLCGLPLDAGQARFDAVLGAADGNLQMGPQRTGALYGQHLLLVFEKDRVVEVHSWERADAEFLSQVEARKPALRLTVNGFDPWSRSRQQLDLMLENRPLLASATESETRALDHSQLRIRFQPGPDRKVPEHYRVSYLQLILQR
jgi:hypothetical protein